MFDDVVEAGFDEFGHDATYQSGSGDPIDCRVVFASDQDLGLDFGEARPVVTKVVIEVGVSAFDPRKDGLFVVGTETYRIIAKPLHTSVERLVWSCKVDSVS